MPENKKISELPELFSPNLDSVLAIVDAGVTYHVSLSNLQGLLGDNTITHSGSTINSNEPLSGPSISTDNSIFLGSSSGYFASNAANSNFLGENSGYDATNANNSNFFGNNTGREATNANNSNFMGYYAGYQSVNAEFSNFFGFESGYQASDATESNFFGTNAGYVATGSSYSNIFGYRAGANTELLSGVGSNNIIIGTNITLEHNRKDSINIGGLIFGTGSHFDTGSSNPLSGSANGKVGINQPFPEYSFDVSGSGRYTDGLIVSGNLISDNFVGDLQGTSSFAVTASYALNVESSFTKDWVEDDIVVLQPNEVIVISGNYVLTNSTLVLSGSNNQYTVGDIIFHKRAKLHIDGYLLIVDSDIVNDGEIKVAKGCILSGSSTITGLGVLI